MKNTADKKGVVILIITLILSAVFFIIGAVQLGGGGYRGPYSQYQELSLNTSKYNYDVSYGGSASYRFKPTSSGYYKVSVYNGSFDYCYDESGSSKSIYYNSSSGQTKTYEVYLSNYSTYKLTFYKTSSSSSSYLRVLIERY